MLELIGFLLLLILVMVSFLLSMLFLDNNQDGAHTKTVALIFIALADAVVITTVLLKRLQRRK